MGVSEMPRERSKSRKRKYRMPRPEIDIEDQSYTVTQSSGLTNLIRKKRAVGLCFCFFAIILVVFAIGAVYLYHIDAIRGTNERMEQAILKRQIYLMKKKNRESEDTWF